MVKWHKGEKDRKEKYILIENTLTNKSFELPKNAPKGFYLGLKGRKVSCYYENSFVLRNKSNEPISPIKIIIKLDTSAP